MYVVGGRAARDIICRVEGNASHRTLPAAAARAIARLAAGAAALIGAVVAAAWALGIPVLTGLLPGNEPMRPATALGLMACGAALRLLIHPLAAAAKRGSFAALSSRPIAARLLAAGAGVLGLLTLIEYATGLNLGIDHVLLPRDAIPPGSSIGGRIAMVTAAAFLLTALALLLLDVEAPSGMTLAEPISLFGVLASWLVLLGWLYGAQSMYAFVPRSTMAPATAGAFLLLSAGMLCARPERGLMAVVTSEHLGGKAARRLLPLAFVLPAAIGWVRLQGQHLGLYEFEFGLAVMVTASSAVVGAVAWLHARALNLVDAERRRAEEETRGLNATLEQRVRARTAEIEAANAELEAFSYSVSHDLRTPLRAIDGFSGALQDECGGAVEARGRDYLARIRAATARMDRMIDDLLNLARLGREGLARDRVDLTAIARDLAAEIQRAQPERRAVFEIADGIEVLGDARLLSVALDNLLRNAWKFTSKRAEARIEVGARPLGEELAVYVRDNGAGFEPAYAGKLFTAFQRLHAASEYEGTGIGLATVQRIVRRHGGRVWADGEAGKGATFYFTLPCRTRPITDGTRFSSAFDT